jgi:hypothetical protein
VHPADPATRSAIAAALRKSTFDASHNNSAHPLGAQQFELSRAAPDETAAINPKRAIDRGELQRALLMRAIDGNRIGPIRQRNLGTSGDIGHQDAIRAQGAGPDYLDLLNHHRRRSWQTIASTSK